ncbi:MAG TPA: aminotransferase class V-fold PLP-dependent enzyme [Phycisphaerales bacterium]|nr:aminotransferase class V-fold PLP-dependent enzyme [Phycisphaerales bacterium]HMP36927.1 aminotransferase class V-fold PLP-dependent enzyme [Phycisphaerales bacterium]
MDSSSAVTDGNDGCGGADARPIVIDVREPEEFAAGSIPGSINVPRGALERQVGGLLRLELPTAPRRDGRSHDRPEREPAEPERGETLGVQGAPARRIVIACQTGRRSALAAATLAAMGYDDSTGFALESLGGGVEAWIAAGHPVTRAGTSSGRRSRRGVADVAAGAGGSEGGPRAAKSEVDPSDFASIRADFGITGELVRTADGVMRPLVYLDHAASTHPPSTVVATLTHFLECEYANVHRANYALARAATDRFDAAFRICAEFVGGDLDEGCVVFTANTTHGCDLVAHCTAHLPGKTLVTDLEHHSNDLPHRRCGEVVRARLTREGRLDLEHVESIFRRERIRLFAVCGAANVTGWMPPLRELARLAHEHGALIAVDAAQLVAHVPIDVRRGDEAEGIDFLVTAGHKAYAPFGIGFVYARRALLDAAPPHLPGGGTAASVTDADAVYLSSPDRHQGGTPNIGGAIAYAAMLRYLKAIGMERVRAHELALMRRAWARLRGLDDVILYGPDALDERVGILTFNVAGVNDMLAAAVLGEEFGVAVRNGRFCAHVHAANLLRNQGGHTPIGDAPPSAVRASFGLYNDEADVDRLLEAIDALRGRRWRGRYELRAGAMVGERQWGGRCADAWMESGGD